MSNNTIFLILMNLLIVGAAIFVVIGIFLIAIVIWGDHPEEIEKIRNHKEDEE